jgi:hypothetical protein
MYANPAYNIALTFMEVFPIGLVVPDFAHLDTWSILSLGHSDGCELRLVSPSPTSPCASQPPAANLSTSPKRRDNGATQRLLQSLWVAACCRGQAKRKPSAVHLPRCFRVAVIPAAPWRSRVRRCPAREGTPPERASRHLHAVRKPSYSAYRSVAFGTEKRPCEQNCCL